MSAVHELDAATVPASLTRAHAHGTRLITPEDDEWPAARVASLASSRQPAKGTRAPDRLWAHGAAHLDEALRQSVTIVGSRHPSEYGLRVASDLASALAANGVTITSGAVSGIDARAHHATLTAGGVTVTVVGYGLAAAPTGHIDLLRRIDEHGVVVSEYPPDSKPSKRRYLARNRLLAALSQGTVLIEAELRSGAHQTATKAAALGRPVMAVPGQITTPTAAACHAMIRAGTATLVTSADEIAETIGQPIRSTAQPGQATAQPSQPVRQPMTPQPPSPADRRRASHLSGTR